MLANTGNHVKLPVAYYLNKISQSLRFFEMTMGRRDGCGACHSCNTGAVILRLDRRIQSEI